MSAEKEIVLARVLWVVMNRCNSRFWYKCFVKSLICSIIVSDGRVPHIQQGWKSPMS